MENKKNPPTLFMSYTSNIKLFTAQVCHCISRQSLVSYYFYPENKKQGNFHKHLKSEISKRDIFVLFLTQSSRSSKWQTREINLWLEKHENATEEAIENTIIVNMGQDQLQIPADAFSRNERIFVPDRNQKNSPIQCATDILSLLNVPAAPFDDLPTSIDARYEKDIITLYTVNKGLLSETDINKGYPPKWPKVANYRDPKHYTLIQNPLKPETYGGYRETDSAINVDGRYRPPADDKTDQDPSVKLTLPEAGPRQEILLPPNTLRIAILVSGGIAPGINAVISSIIDRHQTYEKEYNRSREYGLHRVRIFGCIEGFKSLCNIGGRLTPLDSKKLKSWVNNGGSIIPTSREDRLLDEDPETRRRLLQRMIDKLRDRQIKILYVIGGEGSMRAAHAIWTIHNKEFPKERLSVIGIPKTMDNDILWVWQSFGFLSAVEKAKQDIIQLATEAASNPRVGIVQLFGSSSGYVVSHAALGSNVCDLALIPELDFNMSDVCEYMAKRLYSRRQTEGAEREADRSPYGLIVMAETAIPTDFEDHIDKVGLTDEEKDALRQFHANDRKVIGQTPDELRSAGLKIVSGVLQDYIQKVMGQGGDESTTSNFSFQSPGEPSPYWKDFRVFTNQPRHLIRSMEPMVSDVAYCIRLGTMAVDMALAGYTDCMVSQWLTEYVVVPLKLVVLGRKQVPKGGIFWKTVVSKTGQIEYSSLSQDAKP